MLMVNFNQLSIQVFDVYLRAFKLYKNTLQIKKNEEDYQ